MFLGKGLDEGGCQDEERAQDDAIAEALERVGDEGGHEDGEEQNTSHHEAQQQDPISILLAELAIAEHGQHSGEALAWDGRPTEGAR